METIDRKTVTLPMSEYEYLKAREEEADDIKAELLKEDKDRKYIVIKTRDLYHRGNANKQMEILSESEVLREAQDEINYTSTMLDKANNTIIVCREEIWKENRHKARLYDTLMECMKMTFCERVFKWRKMKKKMNSVLNGDSK